MLPVSDLPTSNHSLYGLQNSGKAGWATSVLKSKLPRFSEVLTLYTNSDISKTNYTWKLPLCSHHVECLQEGPLDLLVSPSNPLHFLVLGFIHSWDQTFFSGFLVSSPRPSSSLLVLTPDCPQVCVLPSPLLNLAVCTCFGAWPDSWSADGGMGLFHFHKEIKRYMAQKQDIF